jgi:hypothetical protein
MNPFRHSLCIAMLAGITTTAAMSAVEAPADQRIEVSGPRSTLAAAAAVLADRSIDTVYEMSTGRSLSVASVGDTLRMRYGRRSPATLRHDGQGRFVSGDGLLALEFELDPRGEPHAVRLTMPSSWQ